MSQFKAKMHQNSFNDFPEIAPTREIATKIEKTFSRLVAVGLFFEWA